MKDKIQSLSRRDILKLVGVASLSVAARPFISPLSVKDDDPNPQSLGLGPEEENIFKQAYEKYLDKNVVEIKDSASLAGYIGDTLNMARTIENESDRNNFIESGLKKIKYCENPRRVIDFKNIPENEWKDHLDSIFTTCTNALAGTGVTGDYGLQVAATTQAFIQKRFVGESEFADNPFLYLYWVRTPLLRPKYLNSLFNPVHDDQPQSRATAVDENNKLKPGVFDITNKRPIEGLVQRSLTTVDNLTVGDVIFKDINHGSAYGSPCIVTGLTYDSDKSVRSFTVFNPNVHSRMVALQAEFHSIDDLQAWFPDAKNMGVLHTRFVDEEASMRLLRYKYEYKLGTLPKEIEQSPVVLSPDFSKIDDVAKQWSIISNAQSQKERGEAMVKLISMIGLGVTDPNGNTISADRWKNDIVNYWKCNLFSVQAALILGIPSTDISHTFTDGVPTQNRGDEYDVQAMHHWFNSRARGYGWADVTRKSRAELMTMLGQGYIIYGTVPYHTFVLFGVVNEYDELIPCMSQAGFDRPLNAVNATFKFDNPTSAESDLEFPNGSLFAHLPVGVKEPNNPPRQYLYDALPGFTPEISTLNSDQVALGYIKDMKQVEDAILDPESQKDPIVKLLNELGIMGEVGEIRNNDFLKYTLFLTRVIQTYQLPLTKIENDPDFFVNELTTQLKSAGYENILNSKDANAVFVNNIKARFRTRENVYLVKGDGDFTPIQCVAFQMLLSLAHEIIPGAPVSMGGLTNCGAQEAASILLNLPNGSDSGNKGSTIKFKNSIPLISDLKSGDTIFFKYPGNAIGHVVTAVSNPLVDSNGKQIILIADSNHIVYPNGVLWSDGMPKVRPLSQNEFNRQFLFNINNEQVGQGVVVRPYK